MSHETPDERDMGFDFAAWLDGVKKLLIDLEKGAAPYFGGSGRSSMTDIDQSNVDRASAIYQLRRRRDRILAVDEQSPFADPLWDMLLDLYIARHNRRTISVSSLCIATCVPPTTALRQITLMIDYGWATRENDPNDKRRVWIALSDEAFDAMTEILAG